MEARVLVIGAGPAGVSVALACKSRGLHPVLVERDAEVGASWRSRYDRLRLNTSRPLSHLPGRRFPRGTPMFPTRDQYVQHLDRHARENGIDLLLATPVDRIAAQADGWLANTPRGGIRTRQVVVTTGFENAPVIPPWPGRDRFSGTLVHSSAYRNAAPFAGRSVLVVGPGCSGMEIAFDLVEGGAAHVQLSARTPPNIVLRASPGPVPGDLVAVALMQLPLRFADTLARVGQRSDTGDLSEYGLPFPEERIFSRAQRLGASPTVVDREVVAAIKARRFEVVAGVDSMDATGVRLTDGRRLEPDAVICATGYRRGLEGLVGHLGVLDEYGVPVARGPRPAAPGLRFVGYVARPGVLGYIAKEAKRTARAIARDAW